MMLPQVRVLANEAEATRDDLVDVIHGLTPEQGAFRPAAGAWSIAEVIEHLVWAEWSGLNKMMVAMEAWRRGEPVWTEPHPLRDAPIEDIVARTWKAKEKAPPIAEPRMGGPLPYWTAALRSCQVILEEVAGHVREGELDDVVYPHYLSGPLTLRQRFEFLRFHMQRHQDQVVRVRDEAGFPRDRGG